MTLGINKELKIENSSTGNNDLLKSRKMDMHITRACGSNLKKYLRLGDFDDLKFGNCVFLVLKKRPIMSRRKQRSSFDQVSEFDRGRIVAYRDCGLSFREIGSRVERSQTTEGTTDRRVRSHPPQCTTSRDDKQIVRMAVTDRSVTSRYVAEHIQSVTHHPVSARTIRRRPHVARIVQRFFMNRQIELLPWPARSPDLSPIENMEIGSRVGRNQTTVMRICDRWMQEGSTHRRVRSHPPQSNTSRADRKKVRMAVTDRSVTSRTLNSRR
ncbi:hypothetical protein LAZ67_5002901 [Cordylochernes scorpioides]|uniref:Transposase Tc1-like domain-containing protein n=1 Tax=Cordylochernes scorpioides TaxID=51811 RepID=A0ABY6KHH6_9ARAC|nr:hypothetical protein LAZ67_5002901 [Cordylochernes scorpioides]